MKRKNLTWLPALIIMIIIFLFSARPAGNSNESSKTIANIVLNLMENVHDDPLPHKDRDRELDRINHIVRKMAHFIEYAVLASAIEFHYLIRKRKGAQLILLSISLTVLYAVSDELHQLFVPGRSGELKDVMIDFAGAVTGTLLFYFLIRLYRYRNNRKNSGGPAIMQK